MLKLREAANLLRSAATTDGLRPIAAALGFDADPLPLDAEARRSFALDEAFDGVALLVGRGALCALVFTSQGNQGRELLARAAVRLITRAPHSLWMILAVEPATCRVFIAAVTPGRRGARVSALMVDRGRVLDSDADTLRQLCGARSDDDLSTHARFAEILGRDAVTRRFFRKLEECIDELAASSRLGLAPARREIALLYASRLLFLGFLESKGWLDENPSFLVDAFDGSMGDGGDFHSRVLLPLFFGTLNTPSSRRAARARAFGRVPFLNGGLFTPTVLERTHRRLRFSDAAFGRLIGELLSKYRFTTLEETSSFQEAAVDPEMLGRAFETLMVREVRRNSGSYYTPHELVDRVTGVALDEYLGLNPSIADIDRIRVLDPACGSGAFLVHALDRLATLRAEAGDGRSSEAIRREVLTRSIFGVDVNPTAVWLCQLRLWLSIVVDSAASTADVPPLPNLDRNIRAGDSLAGPAFEPARASRGSALQCLRERYARSTGVRKASLARELDREERRFALAAARAELASISDKRRDLVAARRGRDLFGGRYAPSVDERSAASDLRARSHAARRRIAAIRHGAPLPFSFAAHFADVGAGGGFSVIVGNPPWVRPHLIDARGRDLLRRDYAVARAASWMPGASAAGAGRGFSSQVDLAAVFVERSLQLLRTEGVMSLLLPSKLWRSLSAGGLRRLVTTEARLLRVEDYGDVPTAFDAAVYPGLLVAARGPDAPGDVGVAVLHRSRTATHWRAPLASLPLDDTPGAPWLLLPPEVRRAFETVRAAGVPFASSVFGRPVLGVKCGLNEAFIVEPESSHGEMIAVRGSNGRAGHIERRSLRPVLRGEDVRAWSPSPSASRIVWTHGLDGQPLSRLPEGVAHWLAPHRRTLSARSDIRHGLRWWSVFRTEAAACDRARVVWADIGRVVRAAVLDAGDATVPLNTCYVARAPSREDARALCALLNSSLASAWLAVIAEQARGGYRRYLGWTMALLPVPSDWPRARSLLADAKPECTEDLLEIVVAAYGLKRGDIEPLLAWSTE